MTHVTLTVAIVASILVLCLRPAKAFAIYIAAMLLYPNYLAVKLGVFDISVGRIVVTVLLFRCLANSKIISNFKWSRLDTWVSIYLIVISIGIPLVSYKQPILKVLENRSGFLMNTFFAYLVARFCITDRAALITAAKWIAVVLVPLAVLGVTEALTGWKPFVPLKQYMTWQDPSRGVYHTRFGFHRAEGPSGQPIMFGTTFLIFLPLVYCLRHEHNYWRPLAYLLSGIVIVGALSSMSSGPWVLLILMIFCLFLEHRRHWVKSLLILAVIFCVLAEIGSNRPLHYVVTSYSNMLGGSGWHRAKLIDLAIEHFDEWVLIGYGGLDPGWGEALWGKYSDITNQYIAVGVKYGLLGVIVLCGMLACAIRSLVKAYKAVEEPALSSWIWSLGTIIVVVMVAFTSCAYFNQTRSFIYAILGIIGSITASTALRSDRVQKSNGVLSRLL